jgi:hypothetical protein
MAELKKIDLHGEKKPEEKKADEKKEAPKQQDPKSTSRGGKFVLIFIVVIVVLFVASFITFKVMNKPQVIKTEAGILTIYNDKYYKYNNFEFRYTDGLWATQLYNPSTRSMYNVPLHYGPKDLMDIQVNKQMIRFLGQMQNFRGPGNVSAVFVTYDPEVNSSFLTLSYFELSQNLRDTMMIKTLPTLTRAFPSVQNATIKTCDSNEPVIYLKYVNPAYIDYKGSCLIIQGQDYEMIKAVDRALLQFYNVMT